MRVNFLLGMIILPIILGLHLYPSSTQHNSQSPQINLEIAALSINSTDSPTDPTPIPGAIGPVEFAENVNPLTGQTVQDPTTLDRLPIVVKISNAPPIVRPQSGISQADIIFEHYAEGGLTRFSAVFYGQAPTRVGSIRSARLIDHEITPMVDGMLVFSGGSIGVETYIYGSDVIDPEFIHAPHRHIPASEYADRAYKGVLYGAPYYWRDENIPIPHNMFANLEAIWELAATDGHARRPSLQGMAFHTDPPPASAGPGIGADIRYRATRVRWEYDETNNNYLRFADGQPHFDASTQTQITADNVVIMYSEHVDTEIIESQWQGNIAWSTQIQMWDRAPVILLRDGLRYEGYWTRTIREHLIAFRTVDDEILYLKPGNTWFQIIRLPEQQNEAEEWLEIQ